MYRYKSDSYSIEFTDRPISAWGGIHLMKEVLNKTRICEYLETLSLPRPGSNRGYNPITIIKGFWVSIWLGANRFAHTLVVRYDKVLSTIFGWKQSPSASTYTRYFRKFSWKTNHEIFPSLQKWFFSNIIKKSITIDLDSHVIVRYGEQEGSELGYNPKKRGRPSHHPLICFIAELRMVANGWLRSGNTSASSTLEHFLEETLDILEGKQIGLVRADSGFSGENTLELLEDKKLSYIVAIKMSPYVKWMLLNECKWTSIDKGIEIAELDGKLLGWKKSRRFIFIRKQKEIYPKAVGKPLLFEEIDITPTYVYSVMVTNVAFSAELVWGLYRQRSDAENRIKELVYDFGIDGFCSHNFWGTEAAFCFALVAYNLVSLFRQLVLKSKKQPHLSTIRTRLFAIGSFVIRKANQTILRLSLSMQKRKWLSGLFTRVNGLSPPFICEH